MRLRFVFSELVIGLRRNLLMMFAVVIITAFSMLFLGIGLLSRSQVNITKAAYFQRLQVSVFLCPAGRNHSNCPTAANAAQIDAIDKTLNSLRPLVTSVQFIDQQQAWQIFQQEFKDAQDLVKSTDPSVLPESFVVKLSDPSKFNVVNSAVGSMPGVDLVQDSDQVVKKLLSMMDSLRNGALALCLVAILVSAILIGVAVQVAVAPRLQQEPTPPPGYNAPGVTARTGERAPGILRERPVRPRKLGHVVFGSTDQQASQDFFRKGLGFKVSDTVPGLAAFMRCSTDHHNVLIQQAPVAYLHHTSWQVDDVDEVGRGASAMLAADPGRHVWGLGRHHVGSNFFWYLRDPAGNFSEYYSDLDCIVDDALWKPGVWEGARGLYSWGPPPPPSFLAPEDLAALMTGAHAPR